MEVEIMAIGVTQFKSGKYYAHPSKEHKNEWATVMLPMLDGQPRKCTDITYNGETGIRVIFEGIDSGSWYCLLDEFIEVPDWNPYEWEFIGNAEQTAGRKTEEGDEYLNGGRWKKMSNNIGQDINLFMNFGPYTPVRRRKVEAPQSPDIVEYQGEKWRWLEREEIIRKGDRIDYDLRKPEIEAAATRNDECGDVVGNKRNAWRKVTASMPSGRIVNIEDAPIGSRVKLISVASNEDSPLKIGVIGILGEHKTNFKNRKYVKIQNTDDPYHSGGGFYYGAKVELLEEPKEEGGEMYPDKFVRGIVMKDCRAGDIVDMQVSGTVSMSVHVPSSEKSYTEKRRERRAKVLGFLKNEGGLE
jgi:hypothetical protein